MEEKQLTEKESLLLISKMISTAKKSYYESGTGAMLWGFTNCICFSVAYLQEKIKGFYFPFNPFLLMIFAFIIQFYFEKKERKFKEVTSHHEEALKYIWSTFGISVFILTVGGGVANIGYSVFPPLLIIFAIPTFITGCINKFIPMIIGGIICWLLGIAAFFMIGPNTYLLTAIGAFFAWVIPGIILRIRFLRSRNLQYGV